MAYRHLCAFVAVRSWLRSFGRSRVAIAWSGRLCGVSRDVLERLVELGSAIE